MTNNNIEFGEERNNNNAESTGAQGSFIEASFSSEDYSALVSAESVQLENPSLPHYIEDDQPHNPPPNDERGVEEVPVEDIQFEAEQVSPVVDYEAVLRKQLIGVHIFCIIMAALSIGVMFLEIFPAILVCIIYLREEMNSRTAKYDRVLLTLTVTNFVISLISLLINVFIIFALCTFTFFLASILFIFILPYTFVFRFVSRELLLNRGYSSNNNLYYNNSVSNVYPASPYLSHHHNIQLHPIHHHHVNSFHPYPHHAAHHVAHNPHLHHPHHHPHHHSPHHSAVSMHHPF